MEITGLVDRCRRLGAKAAPLLVLALIWLWFVIAILLAGAGGEVLKTLGWWDVMAHDNL